MDELKKIKIKNKAKQETAKKRSDATGTKETSGVQHYMGREIVPTFGDAVAGEDDEDNVFLLYTINLHLMELLSFVKLKSMYGQQPMLSISMKLPHHLVNPMYGMTSNQHPTSLMKRLLFGTSVHDSGLWS